MSKPYDIVILGLSITSSWGNGHATTWRSLIKGLSLRGHRVLFLERERDAYATHSDLQTYPYCDIGLYAGLQKLRDEYADTVANAGTVIVGSYVPDGINVCRWVLNEARGVSAFYDIDTPVTLASLQECSCTYIAANQIPEFDLYLSSTGGPVLRQLEHRFAAQRAVPFYCSVDVDEYRPLAQSSSIDLGYMGTYSPDRQPKLQSLLIDTALKLTQRFAVVGPQYPSSIQWPRNVQRIEHLAPSKHREFYTAQRYTLNLTRADMVHAGYSPSVRLFEAAACGVAIISDEWPGLSDFFIPNEEILLAHDTQDVIEFLQKLVEPTRLKLAAAARERVLSAHSGVRRAIELEAHIANARARMQPLVSTA